jgi:3-oxoacyl-[acyl-carrier protein] reductase
MNSNILKNKNCLITGATGGLGKEIAVELVKCGCNLFLTGKQEKKLEKLKGDINQYIKNNSVQYQHTDLLNSNELNYLIKKIRAKFNSIDVLINCAGIFPVNPISKNSLDEYDTCMNLNVRVPFVLAKEFSKDMVKNEWGRIVNIASSGAYNGLKNTTIYRSSKHALLGLSRSLYNELKEFNVRTFCISPGPIKTEMGKDIIKKENPDEDYESFMNPTQIAEFITFVISFDNNLISPEIRLGRIK